MVQSRYSWTDETIHGLLWSRFIELAQMSADARREEGRERLTLAAFVAHQLGAGGNKTFKVYLDELVSEKTAQSTDPKYDRAATDARLNRMGIKRKKGKHQ